MKSSLLLSPFRLVALAIATFVPLLASSAATVGPVAPTETKMLKADVDSGKLPPVRDRLPAAPLVTRGKRFPGMTFSLTVPATVPSVFHTEPALVESLPSV